MLSKKNPANIPIWLKVMLIEYYFVVQILNAINSFEKIV